MNLRIETVEEKQKVLIVSKKKYPFIDILKKELERYGTEVFLSPYLSKKSPHFDYCFCINEENHIQLSARTILLFVNEHRLTKKAVNAHFKNTKIIDIAGNDIRKEHIDNILWFSFSEGKETLFKMVIPHLPSVEKQFFFFNTIDFKSFLTKKNIIVGCIVLFIVIHTIFILPLSLSLYSSYRAFTSFKKDQNDETQNFLRIGSTSLIVTKSLYSFARPTLLFLSLAIPPDTLIDLNEKGNIVLAESLLLTENIRDIQKLLFKKDKSKEERAYLILRLEKFKQEIATIEENLTILTQKLPYQFGPVKKVHKELDTATESLQKLKKLLPYIDSLLAQDSEKKYLLLFANNMEIRPGGGFLGSFGILKVKDYTIEDIEIHDVYDADGQLIAHIDPPLPIRKYLNIIHGFLRDSNFSPDFPEDYETAKMFLEKEINLTGFSGSMLITTTAIEHVLDAFGDVYIPDFNESINKKNFYIKTQIHTEKDFFPGSIQKRSFLGSLAKNLLINLETASPKLFALALKKSLDEKQIVLVSDEKEIQGVLDSFYWSGRIIQPSCVSDQEKNCVVDYLFPYDANVGANKVNFFITRSMYLKTKIDDQGEIQHVFSIQFQNESPAEVFPGGTYKNYFQTMLPVYSSVKRITKDGVLVEEYEEKNGRFKNVGFYFEVPPKKTTEIKIEYVLNNQLKTGRGIYQLVVQKQIGSSNNDYVFELDLPKSLSIVNQNFTPLVKDKSLVYNTSLSADKIFFIELTRE